MSGQFHVSAEDASVFRRAVGSLPLTIEGFEPTDAQLAAMREASAAALSGAGAAAWRAGAMHTLAVAADTAATGASVATGVGGLVKVGVQYAAIHGTKEAVKFVAKQVAAQSAKMVAAQAAFTAAEAGLRAAGVSDDTLMKARSAIALVQVALMGRRLLAAKKQIDPAAAARVLAKEEIPIPAGIQGIRESMAEITARTGREVALLRMPDGKRTLRIGGRDFVDVTGARRVIAHTHPSGLEYSKEDWGVFKRYTKQKSSVLIAPSGEAKRLPVPDEYIEHLSLPE
ncbi:MAG: hypothetical protein N3A38_09145 [Planctomycetota bacterium]|nr:hypothetical protein [Planctomycetota bacterium]